MQKSVNDNYKVNQHCLKSNREDAYIVQRTAITPTQCTRILKITLHVYKAALIKNKTLYDEIKLLFQANFHLHHNCAKHTRKLGWHLIYCSFGLPPCTANTQSLGFFHHVNDWRKALFSYHKFCQLHNSNNKNEQKWQQSNNNNNSCNLHFFFKPRNSNMKHISCKQWFFLVCR